jgi:putative membrane protein
LFIIIIIIIIIIMRIATDYSSSLLLLSFFVSSLLMYPELSNAWTTLTPISNTSPLNKQIRRNSRTSTTTSIALSPRTRTVVEDSNEYYHATTTTTTTTTTSTTSMITGNDESVCSGRSVTTPLMVSMMTALIGFSTITALPEVSSAAAVTSSAAETIISSTTTTIAMSSQISSALFAYGHYFSILGVVGILFTERWTLENGPELTDDEENRLAIADALYGVIGLLIVYTGYYRLSDPALGKGTDFYIHEPIFWLKIAMVGVLGSASLFNTTKIIQRSIARNTGDKVAEPMSQELNDRMRSICNAQLTGIIFIPLAASLMARGVGYNEDIPWQAEMGVSLVLFLGLGFKYVKEALTFEERLQQKQQQVQE